MKSHREQAVELIGRLPKGDGQAAIAQAILALADAQEALLWRTLESFDDLPEQQGLSYVFEYEDGDTWVWTLAAGPAGDYRFESTGSPDLIKDPNDLVDECLRWRYA